MCSGGGGGDGVGVVLTFYTNLFVKMQHVEAARCSSRERQRRVKVISNQWSSVPPTGLMISIYTHIHVHLHATRGFKRDYQRNDGDVFYVIVF